MPRGPRFLLFDSLLLLRNILFVSCGRHSSTVTLNGSLVSGVKGRNRRHVRVAVIAAFPGNCFYDVEVYRREAIYRSGDTDAVREFDYEGKK